MTIDDIKRAMKFSVKPEDDEWFDGARFRAELRLVAERRISRQELEMAPKEIEHEIKLDLAYRILEMLYDNQVREHALAIHDFIKMSVPHPYYDRDPDGCQRWHEAQRKLMELARTMPPKETK